MDDEAFENFVRDKTLDRVYYALHIAKLAQTKGQDYECMLDAEADVLFMYLDRPAIFRRYPQFVPCENL